MAKTAVSYLRTSGETGKANKGFGLETQRREIRDYCKKNKIELVREYVDDGISGTELEKSYGLMEMLAELNGEEYVISKSSCRIFGRDAYRQVMVKRELKKAKKKVILTDNIEFDLYADNPAEVLMNSMMEMLDVYERMTISIRLAKSRRSKVKKTGVKGSGRTPIGYKWATINGERVVLINETTKPVVEFLYNNYDPLYKDKTLEGLSRAVLEKFDIKLSGVGIRAILTNPFFIGKVVHGDIEVDGTHETFIENKLFNRVKRRMKK